MLSLISFMLLLSSFIEYDNHESNTEYNVYYAFDNLYNNKPIIDSIMTKKSNIELIKANKLNEIEQKLYEIESIHEANIFRDFNLEEFIPYLSEFKGIERRMDIYKYEDKVIVDDYAHHPTEIKSIFDTIDSNYQDNPKAVIFQPHLYTRTRDLMDDFAKVLSYFHEVYLLDIYPAREKPINGITSEVLLNKIDASKKEIVKKVEINDVINNTNCKTIAILGAGDLTINLNKKIFTNE